MLFRPWAVCAGLCHIYRFLAVDPSSLSKIKSIFVCHGQAGKMKVFNYKIIVFNFLR